jgi:hypothetical protein
MGGLHCNLPVVASLLQAPPPMQQPLHELYTMQQQQQTVPGIGFGMPQQTAGRRGADAACGQRQLAANAASALAGVLQHHAGVPSMAQAWAMGYGLWAMGYGLWAMGYGLWAMGYGLWALSCMCSSMATGGSSRVASYSGRSVCLGGGGKRRGLYHEWAG